MSEYGRLNGLAQIVDSDGNEFTLVARREGDASRTIAMLKCVSQQVREQLVKSHTIPRALQVPGELQRDLSLRMQHAKLFGDLVADCTGVY